jgi:hypothetical protein
MTPLMSNTVKSAVRIGFINRPHHVGEAKVAPLSFTERSVDMTRINAHKIAANITLNDTL